MSNQNSNEINSSTLVDVDIKSNEFFEYFIAHQQRHPILM